MADNNLEYYIKQDYAELSASPLLQSGDARVWIYYDALNQGGAALPNTLGIDGTLATERFTGSRYIRYDETAQSMRIVVEFSEELNSDTQKAISDYLETAMGDCLQDGFDSFMAVFSSHGGGLAGFGGDENTGRRRNLLQTNKAIAQAIRTALDAVQGAPTQLDVLGFDACLMQAVGAADDYYPITKHILASEAVEPGHGWAYTALTAAPDALALAQQVAETFVGELHGSESHKSPKQLSILDTSKFMVFIEAFEFFCSELLDLLQGGDRSLHAFVSRSRVSSVAFEGVVDAVGTNNPSSLDIGSWLNAFEELCTPDATTPLGETLQAAKAAYEDSFLVNQVGPGTAKGTGMHITWPVQDEYTANQQLWNQVLFINPGYATEITPNYREFLEWFLSSSVPDRVDLDDGSSICGLTAEADPTEPPGGGGTATQPPLEDGLITSETSFENDDGNFELQATITLDVSQVVVEYGLDLSTPLQDVLIARGLEPEPGDFLFLLGGDVQGTYSRNTYTAEWDKQFYFLNISDSTSFEALYVKDDGDGSKTVPVLYFPEEKKNDLAQLQFLDFLFFDYDFWLENGARTAFLRFSVDEAIGRVNDNLLLYTAQESGVFSEMPRSAKGYMVPLIAIDAFIQGRRLTSLAGGFNQTIITWDDNLNYNVLTTPVANIFNVLPEVDGVVVTMTAFDHGDQDVEPEIKVYNVTDKSGTSDGTGVPLSLGTTPPAPTTAPTDNPIPSAPPSASQLPSARPSVSAAPSDVPSSRPSQGPTRVGATPPPTISTAPTNFPSNLPSTAPTSIPSDFPSMVPTTGIVISLPGNSTLVSVNSSFLISGLDLTAARLKEQLESGDGEAIQILQEAYAAFVRAVVDNIDGNSAEEGVGRRLVSVISSLARNLFSGPRRRRLADPSLDRESAEIYDFVDSSCLVVSKQSQSNETCVTVFGRYTLFVDPQEDAQVVYEKYEQETTSSISAGKLQESVDLVANSDDSPAPFVVEGVSSTVDPNHVPIAPSTDGHEEGPSNIFDHDGTDNDLLEDDSQQVPTVTASPPTTSPTSNITTIDDTSGAYGRQIYWIAGLALVSLSSILL